MGERTELKEANSPDTFPLIYIVDDSQDIRDLLKSHLEGLGFQVLAFSSGKAFLEQDSIDNSGCLLLDNMMPEVSGLQVQEILNRRGLDIPIIFMSGNSSYDDVVRAVHGGALYFLQKPFKLNELAEQLEKAIDYCRRQREKSQSKQRNLQLMASLTPREVEIYQLITAGHTNKAIARILGISLSTVEYHRANVMKKLEASSLAELMSIHRELHG